MISKEEFLNKIQEYLLLNMPQKKWLSFTSQVQLGRKAFFSCCMLILFALFFYFAEKGRVQRPTVNSRDIQDNLALVLLALFFLLPIIAFFCLKKCIKAREEKMTSFLFGLFGFVCEKKSVSKSILTESGLFEKKLFLREDNSFWGQFLNTKFSVSEYNINALGFDVDKRTFQNRLY